MARLVADSAMNELIRRAISAVVLAPVVLGAVYFGRPWFEMIIIVAAALATFEWVRLAMGREPGIDFGLAATFVIGAAVAQALSTPSVALALLAAGAVAVAAVSFLSDAAPRLGRLGLAIGVPIIGLPTVALIWLRAEPLTGRTTIFWLLAVVWAVDIGAYAFGRLIGGPRLAPAISPGKTWSGLIGGVACGAAVGFSVAFALGQPVDATLALAGLGLGIIAQLGDLGESWVKRRAGAKDSGGLIPGHGGILDRIDGLWAAAAAFGLLTLAGTRGI